MQLGFVSAILAELSLDKVFACAVESDFDCVEVMCWPLGKAERRYAGVTHIDVSDFSQDDADKVNALAAKHGVTISGLGYYPNPLVGDLAERQTYIGHIKKVIAASAKLGVNIANTFIGREHTLSIEDNWAAFDQVWPSLIEFAEQQGVKVGIENCPMYFRDDEWPGGKNLAISPAIWRRMFERIPSPNFGLNYDPSHMIWQHMDYVKPIWDFADRFVHVHAKDVRLDCAKLNEVGIMATSLEYHTPKLPGLGDINWGQFYSALSDVGYTGAVCVEVEDRAYEGSLEDRKQSLRQSARYLRQFM